MTNEQYLVVSYFVVAAASLAIGFAAFLWMRAPLRNVAASMPWKSVRELLVGLFPVGVIFPALMGFLTVSYVGCEKGTYEKIVANRSYLESKSTEQISASLTHVMFAVFVWCTLVAILLAVKRRTDRSGEPGSRDSA